MKNVATNKPRITVSLDPALYEKLKEFSEYHSLSKSTVLENLAFAYFDMDPKKREALEQWARDNRRPLHQQVQWILEQEIERHIKQNEES